MCFVQLSVVWDVPMVTAPRLMSALVILDGLERHVKHVCIYLHGLPPLLLTKQHNCSSFRVWFIQSSPIETCPVLLHKSCNKSKQTTSSATSFVLNNML